MKLGRFERRRRRRAANSQPLVACNQRQQWQAPVDDNNNNNGGVSASGQCAKGGQRRRVGASGGLCSLRRAIVQSRSRPAAEASVTLSRISRRRTSGAVAASRRPLGLGADAPLGRRARADQWPSGTLTLRRFHSSSSPPLEPTFKSARSSRRRATSSGPRAVAQLAPACRTVACVSTRSSCHRPAPEPANKRAIASSTLLAGLCHLSAR